MQILSTAQTANSTGLRLGGAWVHELAHDLVNLERSTNKCFSAPPNGSGLLFLSGSEAKLDFLYNPVSEYYTYPSIILEFYFEANNTWYYTYNTCINTWI